MSKVCSHDDGWVFTHHKSEVRYCVACLVNQIADIIAKLAAKEAENCKLERYKWAFGEIAARLDRDGGHAQTGDPDTDLERIDAIACEWLAIAERVKELRDDHQAVPIGSYADSFIQALDAILDGSGEVE